MSTYGDVASDAAVKAEQYLDQAYGSNRVPTNNRYPVSPEYWQQFYTD